jgi:hypothetical protein
MTTDLQNMGGVILFWEIIVSFISRVIPNWTDFRISVELRKTKIVFSVKLEDMDKANQTISIETGFSTNMASLSTSKEERLIAQILATKFHTDPATEPESEVRLNPCHEGSNHQWTHGWTLQASGEEEVEQTTEGGNQN